MTNITGEHSIQKHIVKRYVIGLSTLRENVRRLITLFLYKANPSTFSSSLTRLALVEAHSKLQTAVTNMVLVKVMEAARFDMNGNITPSVSSQLFMHGDRLEAIYQESERAIREIINLSIGDITSVTNSEVSMLLANIWDTSESILLQIMQADMGADVPRAENFLSVNCISGIPNTDIYIDVKS